jgi:hypothetical protein
MKIYQFRRADGPKNIARLTSPWLISDVFSVLLLSMVRKPQDNAVE